MAKKKGYITALYERLSRDDDQYGDSISIINQKKMLEEYAQDNGYTNIRHYTDDGFSGGSFERPGWKLIQNKRRLISTGEIDVIVERIMRVLAGRK